MSVRFWRSAGRFAPSYKALFLCSREICTVPSLYRPSTDGSNIRAGNIYRGSATRYFADSANRLRLQ